MLSRCEYWNLSLDAGTTNTRVKLTYGAGSCDLPDYNSFKVGNWNGTQWNDFGRSGATGNTTAGAFQTSGLCANYGPFTIIACKTPVITLSGPSTFCSGSTRTTWAASW